eukprot:m.11065 g.11065  ORF g.11065 m.11065 type:complete len:175 (+) comp5729_c0_seq2:13-537(+)
MFGLGNAALVLAATLYFVGPKNIPYVAYHTGMTIGAMLRYLRNARTTARAFVKEHKIVEMHQHMQQGAQELHAIRSEWQTLTRPTNLATLLLAPEVQPTSTAPPAPAAPGPSPTPPAPAHSSSQTNHNAASNVNAPLASSHLPAAAASSAALPAVAPQYGRGAHHVMGVFVRRQ